MWGGGGGRVAPWLGRAHLFLIFGMTVSSRRKRKKEEGARIGMKNKGRSGGVECKNWTKGRVKQSDGERKEK